MTDTIQQFVDSYSRIGGRDLASTDFFDAFYRHFAGASPEVADKFNDTDMARQREMLRLSLDHMVYFAIDKEETEEIARVAGLHDKSNADIPSQLYDLWLDSLLETVSQFDPDYSPAVEAAWRQVLIPAIDYMKHHNTMR